MKSMPSCNIPTKDNYIWAPFVFIFNKTFCGKALMYIYARVKKTKTSINITN